MSNHLRGGLRAVVGIAGGVGTRRHIADVEHRALGHGERESGLRLIDAVQLPAAGNGATIVEALSRSGKA